MLDDKLLDSNEPNDPPALLTTAEEWAERFLNELRREFLEDAVGIDENSAPVVFRLNMVKAFLLVLFDAGGSPDEILANLFQSEEPATVSADWNSEKARRRNNLIDRLIQGQISLTESLELRRLTAQLRAAADAESLLPLAGARQLHQQLLDGDTKVKS